MGNASRPSLLNLERHKKGAALVLVRCLQHFNERSEHAVRLRLVDTFSSLRRTLQATGVSFHFEDLMPTERAIMATVPAAEAKLFSAFLNERNMEMIVIRNLPDSSIPRPQYNTELLQSFDDGMSNGGGLSGISAPVSPNPH